MSQVAKFKLKYRMAFKNSQPICEIEYLILIGIQNKRQVWEAANSKCSIEWDSKVVQKYRYPQNYPKMGIEIKTSLSQVANFKISDWFQNAPNIDIAKFKI